MRRRWVLIAVAIVLLAGSGLYWLLRPLPPQPPRLVLTSVAFSDLSGWQSSDLSAAFSAFQRSCARFRRQPDTREVGAAGRAGRIADWRQVCNESDTLDGTESPALRAYFERWFVPIAVADNDQVSGIFTGYYEPQLRGSRRKHGRYLVPLYARPDDLVMVNLGRFRKELGGQRIAGRVVNGRLQPFETRAEIEAGALANRNLELLWVDDAIDAFFLHIQGSGRVALEDGAIERIGYAGQNGHPYYAIGRELVARGALERDKVSLQTIRAWLRANPAEAAAVMNKNRSFVFFRRVKDDGPVGAFQVPLTPRASLAVDRRFIPLGVPVWLETKIPRLEGDDTGDTQTWQNLLMAQDTGGAIRGIVRGDIFFGSGDEAEVLAGHLKSPGKYFILLPRTVVERGDPWPEALAN